MIFPFPGKRLLGTALPLAALWTDGSSGVGEFPDLIAFGEWCHGCGIRLIQLLPVNDTGDHASPYFALSAFALNPLYLRLSDLPEAAAVRAEIETLSKNFSGGGRLRYGELLSAKRTVLKAAFERRREDILSSEGLRDWMKANPWIRQYAAFKFLKARNGSRGWAEWTELRDPTPAQIDGLWNHATMRSEMAFYAWVQMRAEEQFRAAALGLEKLGIALKGDLPILLNVDSADVWADRSIFRSDFSAGAPPDDAAPLGQNWGFPLYDWKALKKRGYDFWKARLAQAAKFYHAYRIDHVLGFFRIWAAPKDDETAALGRFLPSIAIEKRSFAELGFDDARLRWLTEAHLPLAELREGLSGYPELDAELGRAIGSALVRIGTEELFLFKPSIRGERDIRALALDGRTKELLCRFWRNRCLLVQDDGFLPQWRYWESRAWASLTEGEKASLENLFRVSREASEKLWEKEGREILGALTAASDMLPCAEDLGAIPEFLPKALSELGILGLRIARWTRRWREPGQPFVPLSDYPEDSVSALSVHDTSTLREWWEREGDHREFYYAIGGQVQCPARCDPETAAFVLGAAARGSSRLFIPCVQDLLALSDAWKPADPSQERVNVPGTDDERNWSYRLPGRISDIASDGNLKKSLLGVATARERGEA
jgi:4-alpha-glucanotransferase